MMTRVAIIGLDCAAPELVFKEFAGQLPHLERLMKDGAWGPLRSTHPPITVPAWITMMSGCDPGELGLYGFRNRPDHSYRQQAIVNAASVRAPRLWDQISRAGGHVIVLGVPATYPVRAVNGCLVADFLTPSTQCVYTYPAALREEVEAVSGGYILDVAGFRSHDKEGLRGRIHEMTRKHFAVARHLVTTKPWDFFMLVEMGPDRMHHGFWAFMDPTHRRFVSDNPFRHAILDYYRVLDAEIGELLRLLPDETIVMVVSDHGAKRLDGGICVNEWLIQEGYLVVNGYPDCPTPLDRMDVDWTKTVAWGEGGYYGRICLNVQGREPEGLINPADYERVLDELIDGLKAIPDPDGRSLGTRVYRPRELYRTVRGVAPDLLTYFGDLHWRSVGSIGLRRLHTFDNDTGPDEANHDWDGIFMLNGAGCRTSGIPPGTIPLSRIEEIAPLVLQWFGIDPGRQRGEL